MNLLLIILLLSSLAWGAELSTQLEIFRATVSLLNDTVWWNGTARRDIRAHCSSIEKLRRNINASAAKDEYFKLMEYKTILDKNTSSIADLLSRIKSPEAKDEILSLPVNQKFEFKQINQSRFKIL